MRVITERICGTSCSSSWDLKRRKPLKMYVNFGERWMKNAVLRICQTFVPLNHDGAHTCLSVGQMDSQKFIVSAPHQCDFIKCVDNTHDLFKTTIKPSLKISFFSSRNCSETRTEIKCFSSAWRVQLSCTTCPNKRILRKYMI